MLFKSVIKTKYLIEPAGYTCRYIHSYQRISIIPQAKQCQGLGIYMWPKVNTHILDIISISSNLKQNNSQWNLLAGMI